MTTQPFLRPFSAFAAARDDYLTVLAQQAHSPATVEKYARHRAPAPFLEPEKGEYIPYDGETVDLQGVAMRTWRNPRRHARREYQQMGQRFVVAKQVDDEQGEEEDGAGSRRSAP